MFEKSYQAPSSMPSILNSSATTRYNKMREDLNKFIENRNLFLVSLNYQFKNSLLEKNFIPNLQEFTEICSILLKLCIMCPNVKRTDLKNEINPNKVPNCDKLKYSGLRDILNMLKQSYDLKIVIEKKNIDQVPEDLNKGIYKFDSNTLHITKLVNNPQDELDELNRQKSSEIEKIKKYLKTKRKNFY